MRQNRRTLLPSKKKKRTRLHNAIRWGLYLLMILIAFLISNTGDYTKPLLLIPIALSIASVSGSYVSGTVGIICGFLMDISSGTLLGYHAIAMFLFCLAVSTLYDRLMQQRFLNLVFFTAIAAFLITGMDFIFCYAIWGYENVSYLYIHYSLPCVLYTTISGGVLYPIFSLIRRHLLPRRKRTVEKTVKPMEE